MITTNGKIIQFTCKCCGETFNGEWDEDETFEYSKRMFPNLESDTETFTVCDDCIKNGLFIVNEQ